MSQHDYVIANQSGAAFRADLNNALAAIVSQNSGAAEPSTTYAYQFWADITAGVLKQRNAANNAWITLFQLDGEWSTIALEDGSATAPSLYFKDSGTDTGVYSPGADQVGIATGGVQRVNFNGSTEVVFNDGGEDIDFRIEGDTEANLFFVDAGNNRVGLGTSTPSANLESQGNVSSTTQFSGFQGLRIQNSNGSAYGVSADINFVAGTGTDNRGAVIGAVYEGNAGGNDLYFATNGSAVTSSDTPTERMRITAAGKLLVGTSTSRSVGAERNLQIEGTSGATGGVSIVRNSNDGGGPALNLGKSRGTATGSNTIINSQDTLGLITFHGADGNNINNVAAQIFAAVDGTPGANDMPGRLVFSTTADGASSPTERMRIGSDGTLVKYGDTNSARILPQTDNAGFIGQTNKRWEALYAVNGTIQTSDEREKTEIQTSQLGADFIRALRPVSYKWKIGGYTSTWDDEGNETITPNPGVRTHYGFIAQEVKQACGNTDFGGWLQEDLNDPESMQSLRLHEFISPIVKALQEALDEIDTLKAEVAALKGA